MFMSSVLQDSFAWRQTGIPNSVTGTEGNSNTARVKLCHWEELEGETFPMEVTDVYLWYKGAANGNEKLDAQPWEAHPREGSSLGRSS